MDWTKAKTILIAALLVANIFLLYLYTNVESIPSDKFLQEETIALLEEKQIYLHSDLPEAGLKMAVLMVEYDIRDEERLQELLARQKPPLRYMATIEEAREIAESFFQINGYEHEGLIFDSYKKENSSIILYYRNEYEGIKIEENKIECVIVDGVIKEFKGFWLRPAGLGQAKKATISPSAALIELMRNKNAKEAIYVENIEMIYWLDPSFSPGETAVSDTALPTWKIEYNEGLVKYVPAFID